jgi:indole-3-glycerol phosphate synthase
VLARQAGEPLRLIAEIKRRSPSAGALSTALSVAERAGAYERAGARLISVLTDRHFFDGAYENLQQARASTSLPLLCKDFIIDERQLDAARAYGADAALLIVRCLGAAELPRLVQAARSRELVPFVEVVTEDEAHRALDAGAELIGVNTRDLDTLAMDPAGAERLLKLLPASVTRAQLSGIRSPEAVARVAQSGVDAALIGEALMRADDPEPLLRQMVASAAAPG